MGGSSRAAVKTASRRKLFTVREANRALPLVQRITADVVEHYRRLQRCRRQREQRVGSGQTEGLTELDEDIHHSRDRLRELVEELAEIGVELKDLDIGLLDFPAVLEGRDICLCWKLGEPAVDYWHDCQAGFAGRRPVRELPSANQ